MSHASDPTHEPAFIAPYRYAHSVRTHIGGGIALLLGWTGIPLIVLAAYSVALIKTEVYQTSPPLSLLPTRDQLRRVLSATVAVSINCLPALGGGILYTVYWTATHTTSPFPPPATPPALISSGSVALIIAGCVYTTPAVAIISSIDNTPRTIATPRVSTTVLSQTYAGVWLLSIFVTGVVFASTLSLLFVAGLGWVLAPMCGFYWFCTATLLFTRTVVDTSAPHTDSKTETYDSHSHS